MTDKTTIIVTPNLTCPRCGAPEVINPEAPIMEQRVNIRAYKVADNRGYWWSECLACKAEGVEDPWF